MRGWIVILVVAMLWPITALAHEGAPNAAAQSADSHRWWFYELTFRHGKGLVLEQPFWIETLGG